MGSATQTFGHATDLGFFSHSFRAAPNLCLMKAKPLQPLITTKGHSHQPPPQAHLRSLLTKLFPAVHALSSPGPDPNKARALYKPCNTFSLQPFPNFATCSAGTARASGHQAKFQLCLPGTLQDMLALRCSLKITDVTPLFCILQCQEQGFFTNNPLSSLPRWSHPKQRSPAQTLARRQPLPRAVPAARQTTRQKEYIARAEFPHTTSRLSRNTGFIMDCNTT